MKTRRKKKEDDKKKKEKDKPKGPSKPTLTFFLPLVSPLFRIFVFPYHQGHELLLQPAQDEEQRGTPRH